jgi:REP element-mobilizing transposase RayT
VGEIVGYFLTWTTYGTWLPGDSRGWVDKNRTHGEVIDAPDPIREEGADAIMHDDAVILEPRRRTIARKAMMETAAHRGWTIHELAVRSNHAHVVVTAGDVSAGRAMGILKSFASRELNKTVDVPRRTWWTRRGSKRRLYTQEALHRAIRYVRHQDTSWKKHSR